MLDMPGWEGSCLIVKSRIERGFVQCPSESRQKQAFYNELDGSIDVNDAKAVKENAAIVKFCHSSLAALQIRAYFISPSPWIPPRISPFLHTHKDASSLLSFHLKTEKFPLQSTAPFCNECWKCG